MDDWKYFRKPRRMDSMKKIGFRPWQYETILPSNLTLAGRLFEKYSTENSYCCRFVGCMETVIRVLTLIQ